MGGVPWGRCGNQQLTIVESQKRKAMGAKNGENRPITCLTLESSLCFFFDEPAKVVTQRKAFFLGSSVLMIGFGSSWGLTIVESLRNRGVLTSYR